jgi:hypothetical protein
MHVIWKVLGLLVFLGMANCAIGMFTGAVDANRVAMVQFVNIHPEQGGYFFTLFGGEKIYYPANTPAGTVVAGEYVGWWKFCPFWQPDCPVLIIQHEEEPPMPDWGKTEATPVAPSDNPYFPYGGQ